MRRYLYNIVTNEAKGPLSFIIKRILTLLSFVYFFIIVLRSFLYKVKVFKPVKLKKPVISVGNITWGGTGKTPLVEAICSYFNDEGKKIALLIRGYGTDEDKLLAENMPGVSVLSGKNRLKNARAEEDKGLMELFVLDDGFQHFKIKRDMDIITIDATNPFGKGRLIPAGILREPLSSLLRADIAVITKSNFVSPEVLGRIKESIKNIKPTMDIFESVHNPYIFCTDRGGEKPLEYVKDRNICCLSGIGDNSSFMKTLKNLGCKIELSFSYMDHHRYNKDEIYGVLAECKQNKIYTVVTTQKDWVKIKELLSEHSLEEIEILILKIKLKVNNEEEFFRRLSPVISG